MADLVKKGLNGALKGLAQGLTGASDEMTTMQKAKRVATTGGIGAVGAVVGHAVGTGQIESESATQILNLLPMLLQIFSN